MAEAEVIFVVAFLIATVTFSAWFTFPGCYDGNGGTTEGTDFLARKAASLVFTITNSVAMISSIYVFFHYLLTKSLTGILQLTWFAVAAMAFGFIGAVHATDNPALDLVFSLFSAGCFVYYGFGSVIKQFDRMEEKRIGVHDVATRNGDIVIGDVEARLSSINQIPLEADTVSENNGKTRKWFSDNWGLNWLSRKDTHRVVHCRPLLEMVHKSPAQLCRHFSFAEIQLATHNFDDAFVLGKGGFGRVYKGSIDSGATSLAIKRLDPLSKQGQKEFWTEINMLSKFRHSHLVSLIGYCNDCDEMILVYDYMSKGSVADHLHPKDGGNVINTSILCWVQRLKICIGAARGLDYLHTGTGFLERIIHRDVKTSNILLDENWAAKISDFGLSKIGPANQSCTHVSTCVKGTRGYIDPDYFLTHRLTRKSDVFSFGVVLFEVLSGRQALDFGLPEEQRSLVGWAQHCIGEDKVHHLIDPNLKWEIFTESLKEFVKIAEQCLHSCPEKRPTMSEVVASLESALGFQERKKSSLLDDYDFGFGGTCDSQETAEISPVQLQVIDRGFLKVESTVSTDDDDDTLSAVDCMRKDDQGHKGD